MYELLYQILYCADCYFEKCIHIVGFKMIFFSMIMNCFNVAKYQSTKQYMTPAGVS